MPTLVGENLQAAKLVDVTSKLHEASGRMGLSKEDSGSKVTDIQQLRMTLCANMVQLLIQVPPIPDVHQKLIGPFRKAAGRAGIR